jgi:hypothetical protein
MNDHFTQLCYKKLGSHKLLEVIAKEIIQILCRHQACDAPKPYDQIRTTSEHQSQAFGIFQLSHNNDA